MRVMYLHTNPIPTTSEHHHYPFHATAATYYLHVTCLSGATTVNSAISGRCGDAKVSSGR